MPIAPANLALYPGGSIRSPEWLATRERIRHRAGDRCEGCGIANGAIGIRLLDGGFMACEGWRPGDIIGLPYMADGRWIGEVQARAFRIVCTVAHVDRALVDHSDANLRFWCQQCHNRHDAASRAVKAAATRQARKPIDLIDLMRAPA